MDAAGASDWDLDAGSARLQRARTWVRGPAARLQGAVRVALSWGLLPQAALSWGPLPADAAGAAADAAPAGAAADAADAAGQPQGIHLATYMDDGLLLLKQSKQEAEAIMCVLLHIRMTWVL